MGFNHILRKIYVRIAWNSTTSCEKSTSASRGIQPHLAKNRVPIWKNIDTRPRTPTPAPQNKVKPKQLLILRKKVSNFFHSRGVCAVNFVLGARGSMRLPWIDRIDEVTDPIDRIDEITVNRSDRCDSLGPIGSMIATQIRVGGLADRFLLRIYSLRVFILKNRPPTRQLEHFQWCFELAGRVGGSRPANSIRQLEFA